MYKFIFMAFAVALAFVTTGCSASYERSFVNQRSSHEYSPDRFLLVTPENGSFGKTVYPASGVEVIAALSKELQRYTTSIKTVSAPTPVDQLPEEDVQSADYIIAPEILHWEDRATGWSMRPDRIEVRFDIYNSQRELIDSYLIKGRSAYIVWVSKQPNSLLPKPIRQMLTELLGKVKK